MRTRSIFLPWTKVFFLLAAALLVAVGGVNAQINSLGGGDSGDPEPPGGSCVVPLMLPPPDIISQIAETVDDAIDRYLANPPSLCSGHREGDQISFSEELPGSDGLPGGNQYVTGIVRVFQHKCVLQELKLIGKSMTPLCKRGCPFGQQKFKDLVLGGYVRSFFERGKNEIVEPPPLIRLGAGFHYPKPVKYELLLQATMSEKVFNIIELPTTEVCFGSDYPDTLPFFHCKELAGAYDGDKKFFFANRGGDLAGNPNPVCKWQVDKKVKGDCDNPNPPWQSNGLVALYSYLHDGKEMCNAGGEVLTGEVEIPDWYDAQTPLP